MLSLLVKRKGTVGNSWADMKLIHLRYNRSNVFVVEVGGCDLTCHIRSIADVVTFILSLRFLSMCICVFCFHCFLVIDPMCTLFMCV